MDPRRAFVLGAGSYFPLNVGNEWVYRVKSRSGGPYYVNRRVQRAQLDSSGLLWFLVVDTFPVPLAAEPTVATAETQYRMDEQGRIHIRGGDGSDQLYFDPTDGCPKHI